MVAKTESTSEEGKNNLDSTRVAQQLALAGRAWSVRKRLEEGLLADSHEEVLDARVEDEDEDEKRDDAGKAEQSRAEQAGSEKVRLDRRE